METFNQCQFDMDGAVWDFFMESNLLGNGQAIETGSFIYFNEQNKN